VNQDVGEGFVEWEWLAAQEAREEMGCVRHIRFPRPVAATMNGTVQRGVIRKPGSRV